MSLLDLPPEIWSRICKLAVTNTDPYWLNSKAVGRRAFVQPSITCTCHTTREECLPHFYKVNLFLAYFGGHQQDLASSWLGAIGKKNRSSLQRLYVHQNAAERMKSLCIALGMAESLAREEDVEIVASRGYTGGRTAMTGMVRLISVD